MTVRAVVIADQSTPPDQSDERIEQSCCKNPSLITVAFSNFRAPTNLCKYQVSCKVNLVQFFQAADDLTLLLHKPPHLLL